ncbi:MAG: hypothetical protein NZ455_08520 [Bacteroidia bacterium]|nr:hypothetical protein [Bacteroidia bacterium]
MRHAKGKPLGLVRSPRPRFYPCPGGGAPPPPFFPRRGGGGGGGVAPSARSTPTLPTRAQRAVGKDTPKKYKNPPCSHINLHASLLNHNTPSTK